MPQVQHTALHCSYLAFIQIKNKKPKKTLRKKNAVFMSGVNILVKILNFSRLKPRYCSITVVIVKLETFGG